MHLQEITQRHTDYYKNDKDKIKNYLDEHKDIIKDNTHIYFKNNKDTINMNQKNYIKTNKNLIAVVE